MRAACLVALAAACGSSGSRPAPRAPARSDCEEEPGDPDARNRCLGFALDQILMSMAFREHRDRGLAAYVAQVGRRVAAHAGRPEIRFTFRVLDDHEAQAYAVLGGYVYVTAGALARLGSEAELAAILAHEVAHVALDHGDDLLEIDADGWSDLGAARRQLAHERDDEIQADERAVSLLIAAGYDPGAMTSMLRRLGGEPVPMDPLDREHEPLARRLARVARAADGHSGGTLGAGRYLLQVRRLPYTILPDRSGGRTIAPSCVGPGQVSPRL